MPSDLANQIANRLGSTPEAAQQGLDSEVERIKKQLEHYGYARISSIGTFRKQERIV